MTTDKKLDEIAEIPQGFMDFFGRLTPEKLQRVKEFYKGQPQIYVASQPPMEVLGRATYVGPSVPDVSEEEKIQIIRDFISRYSGVQKG